jgi:hypothetical protein
MDITSHFQPFSSHTHWLSFFLIIHLTFGSGLGTWILKSMALIDEMAPIIKCEGAFVNVVVTNAVSSLADHALINFILISKPNSQ